MTEIRRNIVRETDGPVMDRYSQSTSTREVATPEELQDARAERVSAVVWYVVGVIDLLLALRIVFFLFGARAVGFAATLYNLTSPLVAPFRGIFPNPSVEGAHFDMAAFAAIIVYSLIGWVVAKLIELAAKPAVSTSV